MTPLFAYIWGLLPMLMSFCVFVNTEIAKSGDLGIWASFKGNKLVKFGEKLASVRLESSGKAYICHK